jgi:alpha-glucosidase (family GH31 glycosyl hydrolase)
MKTIVATFLSIILFYTGSYAQKQTIFLKQGEAWFGAAVNEGDKMPFTEGYTLNLYADNRGNQSAPFLLSSKGRFIWSEDPFEFTFRSNQLIISTTYGKVIIDSSSRTLREAFKKASKQFFPANGKLPDSLLFLRPQYNTWIELTYNQNQEDILKYAHSIIDNGFPAGVLMIDDNWMPYYGNFTFRKDKFPDAAAMMEELHALGFKVMVWVCPFISPDTEVFRELMGKKILLLDNENNPGATWQQAQKPVIINWWNGYSAELDFTNPRGNHVVSQSA